MENLWRYSGNNCFHFVPKQEKKSPVLSH